MISGTPQEPRATRSAARRNPGLPSFYLSESDAGCEKAVVRNANRLSTLDREAHRTTSGERERAALRSAPRPPKTGILAFVG